MATPHISANPGEVAEGILLPGDPKRAKFIAETFFKDPVCFNNVRGILGFTGGYKGKRVSVMGTGMGIPSISIYANELFTQYGVKTAIRKGTAGAGPHDFPLGHVILAEGCCTTSDINRRIFPGNYACISDFDLLRSAYKNSKALGKTVTVGNVVSTDMFYPLESDPRYPLYYKYGVVGVEMEGAGLYTAAHRCGARALCMATVSDSKKNSKIMTVEERERSLTDMIEIALDTLVEFV